MQDRIKTILRSLLGVALFGAAPLPPTQILRYDIITNGDVNGSLEVCLVAGRHLIMQNRYQSQDKVRTLTIDAQLASDGTPDVIDRIGQSFAYQPIDERFARVGAHATWRNRIENGTDEHAVGRFYVPLGLSQAGDSAAYELGMLAATALHAPGGRLKLLPVGTARATVVKEMTLTGPGGPARVRLARLDGLGIEPDYVWLDDADQLFAGRNAIRQGWRSAQSVLDRARIKADAAALAYEIRRQGISTTPVPLLIRNVSVFDAINAHLIPHRDVAISGSTIAAIGPGGTLTASPGERVVDGRGATLLPGLWDMHVHITGAREALRHLASGVTTIRDMGNDNAQLKRLTDRIDRDELPGPTIIKAGFIEGRSPSTTYLGRVVASEREAVAAVNSYADEGYPQIKLYNAVHPEWVAAIARATHARGMRLSGHVPFGGRAVDVVRDGYDEIQHWIFLFLNFSPTPVYNSLTFNTARVARTLDIASPQMTSFIDLLHDHHIATDLTLSVYEPLFLGKPGVPAPVYARAHVNLPPAMLRQVATGPLPTPGDMTTADFQATYAKALALAKLLHDRGIQIEAGTDTLTFGGLALPRELEKLVESKIPPAEVLRIATFEAARVMKRDDRSGVIAPGKDADLLLVDGDPTQDIAAIRQVRLVVKRGIAYMPEQLLAASGIATSPSKSY